MNRTTPMKRLAWLSAAGLLTIAACSSDDSSSSDNDSSQQEASDSTESSGSGADAESADSGDTDQEPVSLVIESWRVDDADEWNDVILPAFEAEYPWIDVEFQPTLNTDYGPALGTKLETGTAGDLIMVEPFDFRVDLYRSGDLANLDDLEGLANFDDSVLSAWRTDEGEQFGLPLAAVIHGFMYNADIFAELGLEEPTTSQEFLDLLQAVQDDGQYTPLAMGTLDSFVPGLLGYNLAGVTYWRGEEGRLGLIEGTQAVNDQPYVDTFDFLSQWGEYMPDGYEAIGYADMQNLFTLGDSAVYPAGSWEISIFNDLVGDDFEIGAFPPPVPAAGDDCFINDHMDMGMAINAASENQEAAKLLLEWMSGPEFAEVWTNNLPGFFSMSNFAVEAGDPMVQEYAGWRENCGSSPRLAYQILSRGEPDLDTELIRLSQLVMNGEQSPEDAANEAQEGLASWYEPQQS